MTNLAIIVTVFYIGTGLSFFLVVKASIDRKYPLTVWIMGFVSLVLMWPVWAVGNFAQAMKETGTWNSIRNIVRSLCKK